MSEDILIEILSRLPAKSLVRFMSVCRFWKSIITSPQFNLVSNRPTRLLVHTNRECYTVIEDEEEKKIAEVVFETDFPLRLSNERPVLMGSDNGLICTAIKSPKPRSGFIIWNPCIRKHVRIPDIPDGYSVSYSSGFGATISGLDHKIVRIVGYDCENFVNKKKAFYVYSLKAGKWRRFFLDYKSDLLEWSFSHFCAPLRGRLHWVVSEPEKSTNYVSTFDLEDDVFEKNAMLLPQHLMSTESTNKRFTLDVTVIKESLAVIDFEFGRNCSLWVMQEYGVVGSWVKMWRIDHTMGGFDLFQSEMVGVLKNGDLLLRFSDLLSNSKLVTCNPETMKTKEFGGGVLRPSQVCGFTNYYKESLVLLADNDRAVADHKILSIQLIDLSQLVLGSG